jgi:Reverse transcriptase (RNA-dependent DNA polymerase)
MIIYLTLKYMLLNTHAVLPQYIKKTTAFIQEKCTTIMHNAIENAKTGVTTAMVTYVLGITWISFVIASTIMEWVLPKHKYIPKRLRWNAAKCYLSFRKVKMRTKWLERQKQWSKRTVSSLRHMTEAYKWIMPKGLQFEGWVPKFHRQTKGITSICGLTSTTTNMKISMANKADTFDGDTFDMVIDSGCSFCMTNDARHFVDEPEEINVAVKGIGGQLVKATRRGTVRWSFTNDDGQIHDEIIPNTYLNDECQYCLYSPQHIAQIANDSGTYSITTANKLQLVWDEEKQIKTVPIDPKLNIFIMRSAPVIYDFTAFCQTIEQIESHETDMHTISIMSSNLIPDIDSDDDSIESEAEESRYKPNTMPKTRANRIHPDLPNNVFEQGTPIKPQMETIHRIPTEDHDVQSSTPQAKLLAWHYRLGHLSFAKIQQMAARGDLPSELMTCPIPRCASCLYGKATRRPWRTKAPVNAMSIPPVTSPGSVVSMDQMVSAITGLVPQMKGFLTHQRYTVATIFVDHFSGLSFVHLQKGSTATETIEAKRAFERYSKSHGILVQHYHADNGIFETKEFQDAIHTDGQTISFCGVNAHHQNGRAEKKIRDLQEHTRTMILHAQHRWPSAINPHLWPQAMKTANDLNNRAPGIKTGISPLELFSQVDVTPKIKHSHTFGAPVYVLDQALQNQGGSIPKWNQRSNVGIYVGISPRHSRKVALVLNLETGHVSPQFHVVIDDFFETLRPSAGNKVPKSNWQRKTGLFKTSSLRRTTKQNTSTMNADIPFSERTFWMESLDVETDAAHTRENSLLNENDIENVGADERNSNDTVINTENSRVNNERTLAESRIPSFGHVTTRSGRVAKFTSKMLESKMQQSDDIVSLYVDWEVYHDESYDIQDKMENPIAFAASSNPDVMYMDQAMKEPDHKEFEAAMIKEVKSHTENEHWHIVKRDQVPDGVDVLPAVWAMRRKRRISTGEVYKWKARLNIHGGKQTHGVNYWETYAPVIGWTTIRLYLILALLNERKTRQIDFVLAYPQADIECDLYMEIPRGFEFHGSRKTHCLLLKKNLYGQKQAGRVWNQYLHDGLIARGFQQSSVDMCLYYNRKYNVNLLIYTDDGILTGDSDQDIDRVINLLQQPVSDHRAFNITDEGTLEDYLGVTVEHASDGSFKLTQPHLIQQIIDDIGFNNRTSTKPTPAASTIRLHRDLHGIERREDWHYRSIIGKLNFLEKSTRPDIAYAVHQCARFSNDPKMSHENAVKRIVKYLVGTKNDGIYIRPNGHSFDCWVDADFVGNWDRVNADVDPSTAKSRTGYLISYGGCPISWASKLQTDVALSTTEAEYTAMSTSLREVIHLMQLVNEANDMGWTTYQGAPKVHCKVFEDNSGALEMARLPKMRPRTKHLCTRMHHFREHVRKGLISINHIDTKDQLADMLTKPQPEELFLFQKPLVMCLPMPVHSTPVIDRNDTERVTDIKDEPDPLRACDIPRAISPGDLVGMLEIKCIPVLKTEATNLKLPVDEFIKYPEKMDQTNEDTKSADIIQGREVHISEPDPDISAGRVIPVEGMGDLCNTDTHDNTCEIIQPDGQITYDGESSALRESLETYTVVSKRRHKREKSGPGNEPRSLYLPNEK